MKLPVAFFKVAEAVLFVESAVYAFPHTRAIESVPGCLLTSDTRFLWHSVYRVST